MKFNLITIDPPWPISKIKTRMRPNQINIDYPLMSLQDIWKLNIKDLAEDISYCFLWTTQKYLFTAKDILENYGFKHLLTMVWKKEYGKSNGMPLFGFRWNVEFILVGIRGTIKALPKQKLILAGFSAINEGHSKKPNEFYKMIEHLGNKRLDIFARKEKDGWICIGNEITGNSIEKDIENLIKL